MTDGAGTVGSAANFDNSSSHARGKARFHARGGSSYGVLENFGHPGRPTFQGRDTQSGFEQIEQCDHERESSAVDDWDAA